MDSQILSGLMACPQSADYNFNQDLQPNGGKSVSLEMGSIVHQFLEYKFKAQKDGMPKAEAIGFGMAAAIKYSKSEEVKNSTSEDINMALNTCVEYENHYKIDTWQTVDVECVRGRQIYEDDKLRVIWKAKFDWIVNTSQIAGLAVDHKTAKQRRDVTNLNNQFTGQCILTNQRLMFLNKIGFQKSLKPEEKFQRVPVNYTLARLEEWQNVIVPFYAYRLVEYAEKGFWPRNYTHCESKYGFCKYKPICENNPNMRDEVIKVEFHKGKKWDIGATESE